MKALTIDNTLEFRNTVVLLFSIIAVFLLSLFPPDIIVAEDFALMENKQIIHEAIVHHDLRVVIYPQEHRFTAEDTVTIPDHILSEFRFLLHKGLDPVSRSKGVRITKEKGKLPHETLESYKVSLARGMKTLVISFSGIIDHPLEQVGKEQARGYSQTMGKIADEGIYLSGHSHWYPVFDTTFVTFSLQVELPRDWEAASQGERTLHKKDHAKTYVRWTSPEPQEEIYLVAGKFHEYVKSAGNVHAMVFLRSPDQVLAE